MTGFKCKLPDGTYSVVQWKQFAPQCTAAQIGQGTCSTNAVAYVPAITICIQRLFN